MVLKDVSLTNYFTDCADHANESTVYGTGLLQERLLSAPALSFCIWSIRLPCVLTTRAALLESTC